MSENERGSKAVWNFSENSSVLVQWPVPKEFQTLIGAAPSAVSYQISSSWLCYQLAGAPSMAVNQAKATSADQTISWWSWAPLMNWGEGSAMGHRVTKKLSHTWTFFNPDVKENSCLIRLFPERKVLVKHHMWLMKTESVWSISWKRFMRLYAACLKVPPPPPNELTIEREGAQIGGWVWPSLEPSPSLATSFYQPLFCPSIVCLLDILLSIKLSILLDVCPRNIFMASPHFRRTF